MDITEAIEILQRLQLAEEKRKAYHKRYMKEKWANDPDFRYKHLAHKHGLTVEEYLKKRETGEIKVGRPRKTIST